MKRSLTILLLALLTAFALVITYDLAHWPEGPESTETVEEGNPL